MSWFKITGYAECDVCWRTFPEERGEHTITDRFFCDGCLKEMDNE